MDLVSVPFEAGPGINLEVHTMKTGYNCNLLRKHFLLNYSRTEGILEDIMLVIGLRGLPLMEHAAEHKPLVCILSNCSQT